MKKLIKSFTFWFIILAILEIYMHQIGQDSKNIMLIYLNPILKRISYSDIGSKFMNLGLQIPAKTIMGYISIYWYIGSIVTFMMYGLILDSFRYLFIRIFNDRNCS